MEFKVIEFSKENKKIILSHTRIYQDVQHAEKVKETAKVKGEQRTTKKAVRQMKDNLEKTTLGDLDGLAKLKSEMEASEKKAKEAKK